MVYHDFLARNPRHRNRRVDPGIVLLEDHPQPRVVLDGRLHEPVDPRRRVVPYVIVIRIDNDGRERLALSRALAHDPERDVRIGWIVGPRYAVDLVPQPLLREYEVGGAADAHDRYALILYQRQLGAVRRPGELVDLADNGEPVDRFAGVIEEAEESPRIDESEQIRGRTPLEHRIYLYISFLLPDRQDAQLLLPHVNVTLDTIALNPQNHD